MIARRFVYDPALDAVIELGTHKKLTAAGDRYAEAKGEFTLKQNESAGRSIREAALERADRRVFAHKRYGDEHRWRE